MLNIMKSDCGRFRAKIEFIYDSIMGSIPYQSCSPSVSSRLFGKSHEGIYSTSRMCSVEVDK